MYKTLVPLIQHVAKLLKDSYFTEANIGCITCMRFIQNLVTFS